MVIEYLDVRINPSPDAVERLHVGNRTDAHTIQLAAGDDIVAHEDPAVGAAAQFCRQTLGIRRVRERARLHEQDRLRGACRRGRHGAWTNRGWTLRGVGTGGRCHRCGCLRGRGHGRSLGRGDETQGGRRGRGGGGGRSDGRCGRGECGGRRRRADIERAHLHHGGAVTQHVEFRGGRVREVDDAIAHEWTAVVDAHHDAAAVLQIGHAHIGGQRQGAVRRAHAVHVVEFAGRGLHLMKPGPVPGGDAALDIVGARRQHVVALAEHVVVRRIAIAGLRFRLGDDLAAGSSHRRGGHRGGRRRRRAGRRTRADTADRARHGGDAEHGQRGAHAVHGGVPGSFWATPVVGASCSRMRCFTAAASS